jgi:serine/threonine-protein kinase
MTLTLVAELLPGLLVTPTVRLSRPLGAGGMGSVWVADHLALKTEVVVKFMSKELAQSPDAVARFAREAAAASQVKSPHVVQTFDHGVTADGVPYIVMELLEGTDLAQHLEKRGKMQPAEVHAIYTQVAKALGKAHAVGIVHRDLKPDNIFLCAGEGDELFVKVLDFGIAKGDARLGSGTTTGQVIGTPYYMSPEQIVGSRTIDLRADIWSLGVVVFELLTGTRPFDGESIGALTLAIHGPLPRPSALVPSLPPALDAWFARSCAVSPADRFPTVRDASRALADALGGAPVPAVALDPVSAFDTTAQVTSARLPTQLSSTQAVEAAPGVPTRSRVPLMLGALVVLAAIIGVGAFVRRGGADATHAAAQVPVGVVSAPAAAAQPATPATAEPAPAVAPAPATAATEAASAKPHAPARPGAVAAPPPAKKPPPAATTVSPAAPPTPPARPAPPRGSDDDIK